MSASRLRRASLCARPARGARAWACCAALWSALAAFGLLEARHAAQDQRTPAAAPSGPAAAAQAEAAKRAARAARRAAESAASAPAAAEREPKGPGPRALRAEAALLEVESALAAARLEREPWRARVYARADRDREPLALDRGMRSDWQRALEAASSLLYSVELSALSAPRRAECGALDSWVRARLALARASNPQSSEPAWYLEQVLASLRALVELPSADERQQLDALLLRLGDLPEQLERARAQLDTPTVESCELARSLGLELTLYLRHELPAHFALGAWTAPVQALIASTLARAQTAQRGFNEWLATELEPRAHPARRLGPDAWLGLVRSFAPQATSAGELEARLAGELALLGALVASSDQAARAQTEPEGVLLPAQLAASVRAASDQSAQLAAALGLPLAAAPRFDCVPRRAWTRVGAAGRLLAWSSGGYALQLELDSLAMGAEARAWRAHELRPTGLRAAGARHGAAGEALFAARPLASPRSPRELEQRALREGFGLYATDWLARVPLPGAQLDLELMRGGQRVRRNELAFALASLRLHASSADFAQVADELARNCGIGRSLGRQLALECVHDPERGTGALAWLEMRALEQRLARTLPPALALRATLEALLRAPFARPSALFELGQELVHAQQQSAAATQPAASAQGAASSAPASAPAAPQAPAQPATPATPPVQPAPRPARAS